MEIRKKIEKSKHISLVANSNERKAFNEIKKFHGLKQNGDMIRFLINQEIKKIAKI